MPTEDPGPDAPRIGNELELFNPADTERSFRKPPPLVVPAPRRRFSPLRRAAAGWSVDEDADLRRARLTVVLVSFVAAVTLVTVIALAHRSAGGEHTPTPAPALGIPAFPALPVPASVEPASSAPPPTSATVAPHPPASPSRRHSPKPSPTTSPAPKPSPTPAVVDLTVGAVISLELSGRPGFLVRHQDSLGRVDEFGPGSSHDDAVFKVGKALVRGCVSLESANLPGYFLRHRNFVIHLDRADDSELFLQDSAFCQVNAGSGAIVLRSVNYPDRYITEDDSALRLTEVDPSAATRFLVRRAS